MKHTCAGDVDLNGYVDGADNDKLGPNWTGGFARGDVDYSGTFDVDDYFLRDANYAAQGDPL